jgi:hypothetical protein
MALEPVGSPLHSRLGLSSHPLHRWHPKRRGIGLADVFAQPRVPFSTRRPVATFARKAYHAQIQDQLSLAPPVRGIYCGS